MRLLLVEKKGLSLVSRFRLENFSDRKKYLFNMDENELVGCDDLDQDSFNFIVIPDGYEDPYLTFTEDQAISHVVASCRITPYNHIIDAKLSAHLEINSLLISRVCVSKKTRNNNVHIGMFRMLSLWVIDHTEFVNYYACCTRDQFKLYKNLGLKIIVEDMKLYQEQTENYLLIKGNIEEVYNNLNILNNDTRKQFFV